MKITCKKCDDIILVNGIGSKRSVMPLDFDLVGLKPLCARF